jgi:hypothetical protein
MDTTHGDKNNKNGGFLQDGRQNRKKQIYVLKYTSLERDLGIYIFIS